MAEKILLPAVKLLNIILAKLIGLLKGVKVK